VKSRGIDKVDGHSSANTNHTDRLSHREVMRANHRDETVNSQPPRVEIAAGDPTRTSLRYHELRRRSPRAPRGQRETSIGSRSGYADHENAVERPSRVDRSSRAGRASGADHPSGVVFATPTRVNRGVLSPQPLSVKPSPLDTGVANVDQKDVHD
jgi:hypothetical protein